MKRRVVVTGIGLLSPLGIGTEQTWNSVVAGRPGIDAITQFDPTGLPCRIAGEVKEFEPRDFFDPKEVKKTGRFVQFAMAASQFAVAHAGLNMAEGFGGTNASLIFRTLGD